MPQLQNSKLLRSLFYHRYLSPTVGRRGWPNRGGPIEGPGPGGSKEVKRYSCVQALNIGRYRKVANRNTRSQTKYVFKLPVKMCQKYQRSPYCLGTRLWDSLDKTTQDLPCKYSFKKHVDSLYKKYNPLI